MIPKDAIEILKGIQNNLEETRFLERCALDMSIKALKEQKPHGEWETEPHSRIMHCSNCNAIENLNRLYVSNFCYLCGADMRKEGEVNGL